MPMCFPRTALPAALRAMNRAVNPLNRAVFPVALPAALCAALALAGAAPTHAAPARAALEDVHFSDVRTVNYRCDGDRKMAVRYYNSDDNHLALLRQEGKSLLFVTVVSGSGARYVSRQYEWWTKGNTATLRDTLKGEGRQSVMANCEATK